MASSIETTDAGKWQQSQHTAARPSHPPSLTQSMLITYTGPTAATSDIEGHLTSVTTPSVEWTGMEAKPTGSSQGRAKRKIVYQ